jgi:serine/threonine protein kinase
MAKKLDMVEELRGTPYAAVRKLAEGGMGEVHVVLRPPAATEQVMKIVKLVDPIAQTDIAKRTLAEGRALRALIHPNIVELHDIGLTAHGRAFLVTELLRGHTLKEEVDKRGPLPIDEVIDIVGQILSGLDTAHSRGLVHRDLKPLNVFYCEAGANGQRTAKILDFGIAKAISEEARARAGSALVATREGYFVGSPAFMAPEQAFGGAIDARTDIYALGALTYYLLTGQIVFNAFSAEQILQAHFFKAPDAPSQHRPEVPRAVDELVLRALAKAPTDRFKSALEMQRALLQLGFRTRPASVPPVRSFRPSPAVTPQQPPALEPQQPSVACQRHPTAADADTQLLQLAPSSEPEAQAKRPAAPAKTIPRAATHHAPPHLQRPTKAEQRLERVLWLTVGFLAVLVLVLSAMILLPRLLVGSLPPPLEFPPLVVERTALMSSSLLASDTLPHSVIERLRSGAYASAGNADTAPAEFAHAELSEPERIGRLVQPRKAEEAPLKVPPKHIDADDFSPGEAFRGYVVSGHFSSGGLSHLYRATNRIGGEFLIKVLKRSYRLEAFRSIQEKLVAEGQLLHSVRGRSPFLVSVHDVGIDSKVGPYVIMDKLEGNSLDVRLLAHRASGVTYEAQKAVRLGILICDGLHSMHELGAVHRDIKPANIFIQDVRERATSQVVLIDWGAAKSPYSPNLL